MRFSRPIRASAEPGSERDDRSTCGFLLRPSELPVDVVEKVAILSNATAEKSESVKKVAYLSRPTEKLSRPTEE